ncbi:MAG: hypothetical protein J3K34DRAFT_241572, partial [Monoraphidium minutum]
CQTPIDQRLVQPPACAARPCCGSPSSARRAPRRDRQQKKETKQTAGPSRPPAMAAYVGDKVTDADAARLAEFEARADPNDREAAALLDEMRSQLKKLQDIKRGEDPRLSFSTPEFKEAQRAFTDAFKKNFGKPVEWAMVKEYPWSAPQLRRMGAPADAPSQP